MKMTRLQSLGASLGLGATLLYGCGGGGAITPPGTGAVVGCYYEKCLPTQAPSGGGTSTPTGGGTSTPTGGGTSTPTGGGTSTPTGGGTSTPTGGGTSTPTGGATSTPTGGATSTPTGAGSASPVATTSPAPMTSPSSGASTSPSPIATLGTLSLNPTLLIPIGITNPATATTIATQAGYTGVFSPTISCPIALPAGAITATANGSTITVEEDPALIPLLGANVFCTLTVAGGGGQTATAMVLLAATVAPAATPTPAATNAAGATPGALTVTPGLFVPVGITNPGMATGTVSQANYSGPFTSSISCPIPLPTGALTTTIVGNTITILENSTLLPGTLGANVLCTLTVTGGANMTGTANVLLGANVGS